MRIASSGIPNTGALTIAQAAQRASRILAVASRQQKDTALIAMARRLSDHAGEIIEANGLDLGEAAASGLSKNMIARLGFSEEKILSRRRSLEKIAELPDPVGQSIRSETRPNGLHVDRVRVPLGVVLMIYEARPHVTVNAGTFCLKSGNAAILREGSEAKHCNRVLGRLWQQSLDEADLPVDAIQVISGSHGAIHELLQLDRHIDLVIPRGESG